jgi:hypothetical protein
LGFAFSRISYQRIGPSGFEGMQVPRLFPMPSTLPKRWLRSRWKPWVKIWRFAFIIMLPQQEKNRYNLLGFRFVLPVDVVVRFLLQPDGDISIDAGVFSAN